MVTPALNGSILPGITRRTVIELAEAMNIPIEERAIAIDELAELARADRVSEVFGSGTAAIISPVGKLKYNDDVMIFNDGQIGKLSQIFYDTITAIQYGQHPDAFGWTEKV